MIVLGGTALAATAPAVAPLRFEYTDANNNKIEIKIATGYEANRVAVDNNGNVYVADAVSNTVSVFNTNGRLVRQININKPSAVGIDNSNGLIYVIGAQNGIRNIHIFDMNGNGIGSFWNVREWDYPTSMAVAAGDIYVADGLFVRRIDARGAIVRDYGPYAGKCTDGTNDDKCKSESFGGISYSNTRHRMAFPQGVAIDEANSLLYVSVKEFTESLGTSCTAIVPNTTTGTYSSPTPDTNCTVDTAESWMYYKNILGVAAVDSTYKYWNAIDTKQATSYYVLVIDIATGELTGPKKIAIDPLYNWDYSPRGLALDGKGRLYVAVSGVGTGSGDIRVYDVATGAKLSVNGKFASCTPSTTCPDTLGWYSGMYATDVAFSPNAAYDSNPNVAEAKGRLFATIGDSKVVSAYLIDGGTNPANTAPGKPVLLEPINSAAVNTSTPTLKIRNATDPQNDPLTYGYEIKDSAGNIVTSAAGITSGSNNETSMTVTQKLSEDSLYHWRTQSFDGEMTTWSDEAAFCVDEVNSNPTQPNVIKPLNNATVSPFASTLSWERSIDSDCSNDIVTYEVTISDVRGNVLKSFPGVGSTSIKVSDISGLVNGGVYNWTVRALDNRGGKSDYSAGSFTYMTTMVKFDSDPAGAKVYMDGNYGYLGKLLGDYDSNDNFIAKMTPFEVQGITPGSHFVTFINAWYEPFSAIVNIPDPLDTDGKVSVVLNGTVAIAADDKVVASMVKASKIRPSGSGVELVKINGGSATPFVVDYNKDGFKDIIAGGKDGKAYLYLSKKQTDGSVILTAKSAVQVYDSVAKTYSDINAASNAAPFLADYDNDGNQDLLLGSGDGTLYLYKGTKDGFVAAGTLALKDSNGNNLFASNLAPTLVDYNNDGKKDLVVGSSDGIIRLYINTGSDESPAFGAPAAIKADGGDLNVGFNSRAFFTDWNSDGKKDIVVGDGSGKASLFFNVGKDDSPEFLSIIGLQKWIKEKKKERGNREYVPYLGYNQDLGDLTGGSGEASPFVVDWSGTSARDIIVGSGSGSVAAY